MPGRHRAALTLPLVRRAVVPHVLVDEEFIAALEQLPERHRAVRADDLDATVDLDHGQPTTRRGDRIALAGVRLLPDHQLVPGCLPGVQVDDRRPPGKFVRGHGWLPSVPETSKLPSRLRHHADDNATWTLAFARPY